MLDKENLPAAIIKLKELATLKNTFTVQYNLGLIYAKQDDLREAETALIQSVKIYPKKWEAYKILFKVQKALGKLDESKTNMIYYLHL